MNEYMQKQIEKLFSIDSPTGFTKNAATYIAQEVERLGFVPIFDQKGNVSVKVSGKKQNNGLGFTSHLDTLGLMVRSITSEGHLLMTNIGGPILPTLDGEYCKIYTRSGAVYTGTILSKFPAAHVHKEATTATRTIDTMEVRIDQRVKNKKDVVALGIQAGDFICYDPKTVITEEGFIKSRFLDDKISVIILLSILKKFQDEKYIPEQDIHFFFSVYEEVGHGMSYVPASVAELIAVDMGCIGMDLNCTEYDVSICAKDSSGPYDYEITSKFITLAQKHCLSYAVDIYPFYGSDASAALRGGNNLKTGLIGPGVYASHGMERTHFDAVVQTQKLIWHYIQNFDN